MSERVKGNWAILASVVAMIFAGCAVLTQSEYDHNSDGKPELKFIQFATLENAPWIIIDGEGGIVMSGHSTGLGVSLVGAGGQIAAQSAHRPSENNTSQTLNQGQLQSVGEGD